MHLQKRSVGIWGFGIVGKAALAFLHAKGALIQVLDQRELHPNEFELITSSRAHFMQARSSADIESFLVHNDLILASPGVDVRPFEAFKDKFIAELDLFGAFFHKPIIAVTGSVGKTTTTVFLSQLLTHTYPRLWTGGNIGTSVLDALFVQNDFDAALLEVSSFQLERCTSFAPTLALWTNCYPNHLDRHGTQENYFRAKYHIIAHQTAACQAIVPLEIYDDVLCLNPQSTIHAFSTNPIQEHQHELITAKKSCLFYSNHRDIYTVTPAGMHQIISNSDLPALSFIQNWVLICGALHQLGIPCSDIKERIKNDSIPKHRLELIKTISGVDFYNDSKATAAASTLAAVDKLQGRPIILILGGLSKGVSRQTLIKELEGKVREIYCFGNESKQLSAWCNQFHILSHECSDLLQVCAHLKHRIKPGDQVLFSPAGTSFDLFHDYKDRGNQFIDLIDHL